MSTSKADRIKAAIQKGQQEVEALASANNERTAEILESIEARTDAKVAKSVALSIDLLRLILQMLTVVNKCGAPDHVSDELREHAMTLHTRATTHMLCMSTSDDKAINREVDCLTKLMDANVANLLQMERVAQRISTEIQTIVEGK